MKLVDAIAGSHEGRHRTFDRRDGDCLTRQNENPARISTGAGVSGTLMYGFGVMLEVSAWERARQRPHSHCQSPWGQRSSCYR